MDFAFTEEQEMLRGQARSFLEDKFSADRVAELARSDDGWDPASWAEIASLGWTGLSVPESSGGSGMGFVDEAVIFEELGRGLYPGPYLSTVGLALPALAGSALLERVAAGEASATLASAEASGPYSLTGADRVATKAEKSNGSWSLTGEKSVVPDLGIVDHVVVVATSSNGPGLWLVDAGAEGVTVRAESTMDRTRRLGTLSLAGAPGELLVEPGDALEVLAKIRLRALSALALEAVGVAQRALDLSIEHVKTRNQFDKPIGAYQAVSHQVANAYVETELARSLAYWAAWCVDQGDEQASSAVAAAKAAASEAAVGACEHAIQVHGGIGFTWEHPLHLFYKRAQWIESYEGSPAKQRSALAATLLD